MSTYQLHRDFELLARQLRHYADACEPAHRARPTPGSPADRQTRSAAALPVEDAWSTPKILLTIAEDHLRLVAAALEAPKVLLGVDTAARVALETSARACWLLGVPVDHDAVVDETDPEGVRARVARYYSHRLSDLQRSVEQTQNLSEYYPGTIDAARVAAHIDYRQGVARQVRANGFTVGRMNTTVEVDGHRPPPPTELAGIAFGIDAPLVAITYDHASAIAHGRVSAVVRRSVTASPAADEMEGGNFVSRQLAITNTDAATAIGPAVFTHGMALAAYAAGIGHHLDPRWVSVREALLLRVRSYMDAQNAEPA